MRKIREAKNKLNEIVQGAPEGEGPQILKSQTSLLEFFQYSPLAELDLKRDRSPVDPGPEL